MLSVPWKFSKIPRTVTVIYLLITGAFLSCACAEEAVKPQKAKEREKLYMVVEAISGDTVLLESGSLLRFASVKAPDESHESSRIRNFAVKSREFTAWLTAGKRIWVEMGSQLRDDRGNYQGFAFLEDGTFVNLELLRAGYVKLAIEPPNFQYADELRKVHRFAKKDREGLWQFEESQSVSAQFVGNKMTKKFHYPDCEMLEYVPQAHRTEFRSRVRAKAAKYRYCSICRNRTEDGTELF